MVFRRRPAKRTELAGYRSILVPIGGSSADHDALRLAALLLQDADGQVAPAHSVSAGLDYPGVGPEHASLRDAGRATYVSVTDAEALDAFGRLARLEGIIPALESAHAVAHVIRLAPTLDPGTIVLVSLSGRGDKDVQSVQAILEEADRVRN